MVVVNRLSKYAYFIPMKHPFPALSVAKAFVTHVVRLHGFPTSIVSDRDNIFLSSFCRDLFQLQGTTLQMSSHYHPQTDGQNKIVNRILEQYLLCFAGNHPHKWIDWVPWAKFSYNMSVHSSTGMMPFEAVYGVTPPTFLSYISGTRQVASVDSYLWTENPSSVHDAPIF